MAQSAPVAPQPDAIPRYGTDFLDLTEYMARTGVKKTRVYERIRNETFELPLRRVGKQWLIPRAAYEEWVQATLEGTADRD